MNSVTSIRFGEIVDQYSNPSRTGTAAAKLNKLLRNPSLSSDLVQNAIIDAICDVMRLHPDRELTERSILRGSQKVSIWSVFSSASCIYRLHCCGQVMLMNV